MTSMKDLVDKNDRVVGKIESPTTFPGAIPKGRAVRTVRIFLFAENGGMKNGSNRSLLLQKRVSTKRIHPNLWTASATGGVEEGESYKDAALRECEEELGVTPSDALFLFKSYITKPHPHFESTFVAFLNSEDKKKITPRKEEVAGVAWLPINIVDNLVKKKPRDFTPSFRSEWKKYRRMQGLCPSKQQCIEILKENNGFPNVSAHCQKVSELAVRIAKHLKKKKIKVNMRLVESSALLHDLMRGKNEPHVLSAHKILSAAGFPVIADTVRSHGLSRRMEFPPITWEQKIVFYADKRVIENKIVKVEDRFSDFDVRYPKDKDKRHDEYIFVKSIEKELMVTI
jgi:isopentenyldiphosphate isomerase